MTAAGARASRRSSTARAASASRAGAGVHVFDVNQLLKQFAEATKLMKQLQQARQGQAGQAEALRAARGCLGGGCLTPAMSAVPGHAAGVFDPARGLSYHMQSLCC